MNAFEKGFHIGAWSGITVFVLGLVAGGGCASRVVMWEKPGATEQQFSADKYACMRQEAQQNPVTTYQSQVTLSANGNPALADTSGLAEVGGNLVPDASRPGMITNQRLYGACMEARGYQRSP